MKVINFSEENSVMNQYLAELRDKDYQKNRLLFRNNIRRIGEVMAYEVSKTLDYAPKKISTPNACTQIDLPSDDIVVATIFRAGLPLHTGFLNVFDRAENAFVSAYREYTNEEKTEVNVNIEYLATPNLDGKTLIIADPMLATGGSMELAYRALETKGKPKRVHLACVIATPEGLDFIKTHMADVDTTVWCAAIDPGMNEHKYIVPGFGDAGDLCFGDKL